MSERLYKRAVKVTIARPIGFFDQEPNARVIEDLRVKFQITKSLRDTPNSCRMTIANLSEETRSEVERKPLYVRLEAGYEGSIERLFAGDSHFVSSHRDGADWITEFQLGDGLRALRWARISRSFGAVDALAIVKETAKALGLTVRVSDKVKRELRSQYLSGVSLEGSARDVMERTLAPFGVSWSIQDGRLQILLPSEVRDQGEVTVEQPTGLIGSPQFGDPPERGSEPTLTVQTLLAPRIGPGSPVRVRARAVDGSFKATRVTHQGDTHGSSWTTDVECRPR